MAGVYSFVKHKTYIHVYVGVGVFVSFGNIHRRFFDMNVRCSELYDDAPLFLLAVSALAPAAAADAWSTCFIFQFCESNSVPPSSSFLCSSALSLFNGAAISITFIRDTVCSTFWYGCCSFASLYAFYNFSSTTQPECIFLYVLFISMFMCPLNRYSTSTLLYVCSSNCLSTPPCLLLLYLYIIIFDLHIAFCLFINLSACSILSGILSTHPSTTTLLYYYT